MTENNEHAIKCPKCSSRDWKVRISPVRPEEDRFFCEDCKHEFRRYDGTKYEKKGEVSQ